MSNVVRDMLGGARRRLLRLGEERLVGTFQLRGVEGFGKGLFSCGLAHAYLISTGWQANRKSCSRPRGVMNSAVLCDCIKRSAAAGNRSHASVARPQAIVTARF